jgi:hypothetical protein
MCCKNKVNRTHAPYSADTKQIESNCNEISFFNNGTDRANISIDGSTGILKTLAPGGVFSLGSDWPETKETDFYNITFEGAAGAAKLVQVMRTYIRVENEQ